MTGSFTIALSFEEYLAANRLMVRHRWYGRGIARFVLVLWAIYAALGLGATLLDGDAPDAAKAGIIAGCGLLMSVAVAAIVSLINMWRLPRSARKTWAQQHVDGLATHHEYDDRGIRIASERGSSNLEWSMFSGWIEDERMLMMFRTAMMFHVLPKTQVPAADIDRLRQMLIASAVRPRC